MSMDEPPDNLIKMKLKRLDLNEEYQDNQISNLQDEVRRLTNIHVPSILNAIHNVNNNINSHAELSKLRDDNNIKRLERIDNKITNVMWGGIFFSFCIMIVDMMFR